MEECKCCLCGKDLDGYSSCEYRGFISCIDCLDKVIKKVDIRRAEIISRSDAITAYLPEKQYHNGEL